MAPPPRQDTVRREPLTNGAYEAIVVPDPNVPRPVPYMTPSCPSGTFCTPPEPSGARAPAPYEACAAVVPAASRWSPPKNAAVTFQDKLTARERASAPDRAQVCCYEWYQPCPGGRTLRDVNEGLVAETTPVEGWCDEFAADDAPNAQLAEAWAREAAYEHASVASFNLAAIDWMGLGAPAKFIEGAQRAALDEIAHARALYTLASSHGGHALGPGPLPLPARPSAPSFARVTAETFLDACVNECIAAAMAAERARLARDADVRAALSGIAEDEERHAELAWSMLAWLVANGGDEARAALENALRTLDALPDVEPGPDAPDQGFLSMERRRELRDRVVEEIVRPCVRALAA